MPRKLNKPKKVEAPLEPVKPLPKSGEVRPVGARALKSVLDTLRPYLVDAQVLDLYGGQGRFGWGAFDEGAASVTFVEKYAVTAKALRDEAVKRRAGVKVSVVEQDVLNFLAQQQQSATRFDVIFADPPFPFWKGDFSERLAAGSAAVAAVGAVFLVKHPERVLPSERFSSWKSWKTTRFGEAQLLYFTYADPKENSQKTSEGHAPDAAEEDP